MSTGRCSPEPCARMQQHVLDDRIGALAVLHHLVEIALQACSISSSISLARRCRRSRRSQRLAQLVDQLDRERREIVDEVQRVLDLVRDAGGQLAERGELLGLDQTVLRGSELLERFRQFPGAGLDVLEQARVLDREHGLSGEGLEEVDRRARKRARLLAADHQRADDPAGSQQWNDQERAIACARTRSRIGEAARS